jgi:hypothetical protein
MHDAAQGAAIILALGGPVDLASKCGTIFAHCSSLNQNKLEPMTKLLKQKMVS